MWYLDLQLDTPALIGAERRRQAAVRRLQREARAGRRNPGVPLPGWLSHVRPATTRRVAEPEAEAEAPAASR